MSRKQTLLKKFTKVSKVYAFISDGVGCENVETIRITTAKVVFGLRFKKRGWLMICLVRSNFLIIS